MRSSGADDPVETIICASRVAAALATASSASGWKARIEETADR